jgi:hypothetical protein
MLVLNPGLGGGWIMLPKIFVLLFGLFLLVACNPVKNDQDGQTQAETPPTDQNSLFTPSPSVEITWNTSPQAVVVSAASFGGFVPPLASLNALPAAQLWGDGRFVWVTYDETQHRQVWQSHLEEAQIADLLEMIDAAGFYTWLDRYENPMVMDAPETCLVVSQVDRAKKVCEYVEGAPQAFHELYALLASGLGLDGQPFVPERGYLVSHLLGKVGQRVSQVDGEWQQAGGVSLADSTQGVWIDGEALEAAWTYVNASPWGMVIQEGDTYYGISVQVPELSLQAPPAAP